MPFYDAKNGLQKGRVWLAFVFLDPLLEQVGDEDVDHDLIAREQIFHLVQRHVVFVRLLTENLI